MLGAAGDHWVDSGAFGQGEGIVLFARRVRWGVPAGLALGLALVVVAFMTAWPGWAGGAATAAFHPKMHLPFTQPQEFKSHGAVLNVTLVAEERTVQVSGDTVLARVYNGAMTGPTLVVKPGDTMRVTLVNHLSEDTNLHFHGTSWPTRTPG